MTALSESPTSVRVRKLEPWIIQTHTNLAKNEGISLEAYLRILLEKQALKAQEDFADLMEKRHAEITTKFGTNFADSVEVIRAVRQDSDVAC